MKNIAILILTLFYTATFTQCKNKSPHNHNGKEHEHKHEKTEQIELNEGQKWKVNKEMLPHISASDSLVNQYFETKSTDFKKLATELKENNKKLVKSCTMKGKSHDALHLWLHPYMEMVDDLNSCTNEEEANKQIKDIQKSFEKFSQYFE